MNIDKIVEEHKKAFGEKFRLWSEYGWWIKQIKEFEKELTQQVKEKEVLGFVDFMNKQKLYPKYNWIRTLAKKYLSQPKKEQE